MRCWFVLFTNYSMVALLSKLLSMEVHYKMSLLHISVPGFIRLFM